MGKATVVGEPTDNDFRRLKALVPGHVKCSNLEEFGEDGMFEMPKGWMLKSTGGALTSFAEALAYQRKTGKMVWLWYQWLDTEVHDA